MYSCVDFFCILFKEEWSHAVNTKSAQGSQKGQGVTQGQVLRWKWTQEWTRIASGRPRPPGDPYLCLGHSSPYTLPLATSPLSPASNSPKRRGCGLSISTCAGGFTLYLTCRGWESVGRGHWQITSAPGVIQVFHYQCSILRGHHPPPSASVTLKSSSLCISTWTNNFCCGESE